MLMITSSPAIDPDTSEGEIAHFVAVNPEQAVASRRLHNLVEFLIWSVPQCFGGGMIEDTATRSGTAQETEARPLGGGAAESRRPQWALRRYRGPNFACRSWKTFCSTTES
jgi:hypothetical protein